MWFTKKLSQFKQFEFQSDTTSVRGRIPNNLFTIDFNVGSYRSIFNLGFYFFGLISIELCWSRCCDHPGILFQLTVFRFLLSVEIRDMRHWDDEKRILTDEG